MELDGQLPLFEVANTTTVRFFLNGEPEPEIERQYIDYLTWAEDDEDREAIAEYHAELAAGDKPESFSAIRHSLLVDDC